ncbi:MAG: gamma-glutamyl-gamma-aminobutyrate hydrolase family protein [Chloroflexi bacterium]|nr:gamma-glutamyl-gamma-aminobutyrate hydrolase family protein [Chloroflexota bacterium]
MAKTPGEAAPLIGVTTGSSPASATAPERAQVNAAYLHAVQQAGGVPVLLPPQLRPAQLLDLLQALDGIVLTGGGDISPALYGEEPHPATEFVSEQRDSLEIACLRYALEQDLPLLCICRGMQVLNVALGGSLVQDIPSQVQGAILHRQAGSRSEPTHAVWLKQGSRTAELLGTITPMVNALHHQAVNALGQGLEAVGQAPDGVVEAIEMPGREAFLVAVQWHPEEMVGSSEEARRIFEGLVAAAKAPAPARRV